MRWNPLIIVLLLACPITTVVTVNAHSQSHQHYTTLYALTFPPQKKCVILWHPNAHALQKINEENMQYNARVQAGSKSTEDLKCPSNHSKSFCSGWTTIAKYNVREYKAGESAGQKNSQGLNFTSWSCPAGHTKSFCVG
jgi:hypothetical protein